MVICEFSSDKTACTKCGTPAPDVSSGRAIVRTCQAIDFSEEPWRTGIRTNDAGLGDTVARWLSWAGIRKTPGCGCGPRQQWLNRLVPYEPIYEVKDRPKSLLINWNYGLGDAVQITTILLHLAELYPDWAIDMLSPNGHASLFDGLCRRSINLHEVGWVDISGYGHVRNLRMLEPERSYADSPASKPEVILRRLFGIEPIERLCRYEIHPSAEKFARARECLSRLAGSAAVMLLHYQGMSLKRYKDLPESTALELCRVAESCGCCPVVLDTESTSQVVRSSAAVGLHADDPVWGDTGIDGATIAALGSLARLCVGIDSGPGHAWGATHPGADSREERVESRLDSSDLLSTFSPLLSIVPRTIIAWPTTRLHPLHFYGLADHVLHVVRRDHAVGILEPREVGAEYFASRYRHHVCERHMREELPEVVAAALESNVNLRPKTHSLRTTTRS